MRSGKQIELSTLHRQKCAFGKLGTSTLGLGTSTLGLGTQHSLIGTATLSSGNAALGIKQGFRLGSVTSRRRGQEALRLRVDIVI
jgi:hypothetical protein